MKISLLWGCDPSLQFEKMWIYFLLSKFTDIKSYHWYSNNAYSDLHPDHYPILVESGLKRLEKSPSTHALRELHDSRLNRFNALSIFPNYSLIHLSDEEGLDADSFYGCLDPNTHIFRNFHHPRLNDLSKNIFSFPIGPRHVFLDSDPTTNPKFNVIEAWKGSRKMILIPNNIA